MKSAKVGASAGATVVEVSGTTDLRSITREPKRFLTTVDIADRYGRGKLRWLTFGECNIRVDGKNGRSWIEAHLADYACDFEHDTAWAVKLPLIGLRLADMGVHYSRTYFEAWVDPDAAGGNMPDFHVPRAGYDPTKHPKARVCEGIYDKGRGLYCKWNEGKKHVIVPEGFYVPPFDAELYKVVRGKRVEIVTGPADEEEDDE